MDIKELAESYFMQKDGIKRHQILLKITFQCEYASKEFFEKAFKKERKLEEKLTALRGIAFFATEQDVEIYANKLLIAVMKVPQTTPYVWFLKEIGHGGCMFEFMGYGLTGKAIFADETLAQRENGLPDNLMIIQNCDEYFDCINVEDGSIVTWSQYDKDGVIDKAEDFYSYFLECIEDAIENY